jgi:hypothetical protein
LGWEVHRQEEVMVMGPLDDVVAALEALVKAFDVSSLDGEATTRAAGLFARVEHLGAAGRVGVLRAEDTADGRTMTAAAQTGPASAAGRTTAASRGQDSPRLPSSTGRLRRLWRAARTAVHRRRTLDREEVHRSRYFRHWVAEDGAFEAKCRLTSESAAVLLAAVEVEHDLVLAQARAAGERGRPKGYRADALVNLARHRLCSTGPRQ